MHQDKVTGQLIGKVEIPEKGWFHDHFMTMLLGKELAEDLGILESSKKHWPMFKNKETNF